MDWLACLAKYFLFFFNLVIVIGGIVFIAVGAIIISGEHRIPDSMGFSFGAFAIGIGVAMFIIAFLGFCGAIRKIGCMLTAYAIILIVLLIIQITMTAFLFIALHKFDTQLQPNIMSEARILFDDYYSDSSYQKIVDDMQQDFKCCGVEDSDYWFEHHKKSPPSSCHEDNDSRKRLFKQGCAENFEKIVKSNFLILAEVAGVFAIIELLGATFACVLKKRARI